MEEHKPQLSIVIVNYNVRFFLEQTLISIRKSETDFLVETIVIDNNSHDGSDSLFQETYSWVRYIKNHKNVGFSKANNQGFAIAKGKYILILNPDTVLQENTLQLCYNYLNAHPDVGALGIKMIDGQGIFLPESKRGLPTPSAAFYKLSGLSSLFSKSKKFGKYHAKYIDKNTTAQVDILSGAFMFTQASILKKVKGFDEDYFMYGEDIDLSYKITKEGYKNIYFAESQILHYKGESTKKDSINYVKVFYNAMALFVKKHFHTGKAGIFNFIIQFAILGRALLALGNRGFRAILLPLVEFLLLYFSYFAISKYWEHYNKFVRDFYPQEYYFFHIPSYILFLILGIYLSGGYDKPYIIKNTIRGSFLGSIALFSVYAFLPKDLQFSRAILGLGCMAGIALPVAIRYLLHWINPKSFALGKKSNYRILFISTSKQLILFQDILFSNYIKHEFLGHIGTDNEKNQHTLGTLDDLEQLIEIYQINVIVFDGNSCSNTYIIKQIEKYANKDIEFKIIPQNTSYIIGSSSKNKQGELLTMDPQFNINQLESMRMKKFFDVSVLLICLFLFPLFFWHEFIRKIAYNAFSILFNKKTIFSYSREAAFISVPKMNPGLFPIARVSDSESIKKHKVLAYAQHYTLAADLKLLLQSLREKAYVASVS